MLSLKSITGSASYKYDFRIFMKYLINEDKALKDVTSKLLGKPVKLKAHIIAKSNGILCGVDLVKQIFKYIDEKVNIKLLKKDGSRIKKGDRILDINGKSDSIVKGERIALNMLQHLSGIASYTRNLVDIIKDTDAKLLDTRKTTPFLRYLEKYAVKTGGGYNHRLNLEDGILIKENHIRTVGGISEIDKILKKRYKNIKQKIEIEVENISEFKEALALNVDIIMLDNFNLSDVKKAVLLNAGKKKIEVSGNIKEKTILKYARCGVDYVSVGSITHSAQSLDFSLLFI